MTEQSMEYFKAGNVVSRSLDSTVNDSKHVLLRTIMMIKGCERVVLQG